MGLDMYLNAKIKGKKGNGLTGAAGGMIPIAPKVPEDNIEIGYWRKNYELQEFIMDFFPDVKEDNCVDFELTADMLEELIAWSEESEDEHSVDVFINALSLMQAEGAKISYFQWY